MNLTQLTADIVEINNNRLAGKITRQQHADMIARINRIMTGYGWTWADIETQFTTQTAPGVTFRRPGAMSPQQPLPCAAKGRAHV
jgi:hypothetical protein